MATIIVTGVSRGVGQALAERLLTLGHRVVGISRKRDGRLAAYEGDAFVYLEADLGDTAQKW
ncbi:SDR family NAD(P)-dependent oxidoreductase [Cohnella sp. GCM10020058]|uniref:SDR family NAD(P)-dependent oxidoreductase n=1 Tax=Cohnella sp. GCM10020058 TaxID=3317330 RepID=UPI00362E9780